MPLLVATAVSPVGAGTAVAAAATVGNSPTPSKRQSRTSTPRRTRTPRVPATGPPGRDRRSLPRKSVQGNGFPTSTNCPYIGTVGDRHGARSAGRCGRPVSRSAQQGPPVRGQHEVLQHPAGRQLGPVRRRARSSYPTTPTRTCSSSRTGSAGNALTAGSVTRQPSGRPPAARIAGSTCPVHQSTRSGSAPAGASTTVTLAASRCAAQTGPP